MSVSTSMEDYLRTLYMLWKKQPDQSIGIKAVDVAKALNVSKPSVSSMVKKLIKLKYLKKKPYAKILFTKKGAIVARQVTYSHEVVKTFLTTVLQHDKNLVQKEAHRLEHAFSHESIKRLDRFLKQEYL